MREKYIKKEQTMVIENDKCKLSKEEIEEARKSKKMIINLIII